jgi:hypothetical protein
MATAQELRERLAQIDEILSIGVKQVETDESITHYDLDSMRKERQRIERQLPEYKRNRRRSYGVTGLGH